jgi:diguanylate cyclase (GGDEF)-like protein/PAS domain S-box-containing protein
MASRQQASATQVRGAAATGQAARPRRRARLSTDSYQTIFENSAVAITVTDENENIVSWNRYAAELLGMDQEDLHMRPVRSLYPDDEWATIRSQNVRQKGIQHHIDTKVIRKDQGVLDIDLSVTVLKGPDGAVTGSIGIMADITDQKKAEEALRRSEEMSRGMIEAAATGMYLLENGRFTYVNRLMEEISGYPSDELIGKHALDCVHPDDREMASRMAVESLEGRSTRPYEFRAIRKDLEVIWVSERVTSIEYGGNRATLGTLMDITDRRRAEVNSQEHTKRVETLLSIGSTVGKTLRLSDLLDSVLGRVFEVMRLSAGAVFLVEKATGDLVLAADRGLPNGIAQQAGRMKTGRGFAGRTALSGKPVVVGSSSADGRFDPVVLEREGLRSLCSVPIMARDEIMGVMTVASAESPDFTEADVRLLSSIAGQVGMAIENAQLYEKTVEIAFTDDLTGLYNRRYLMEQIEREHARALRSGGSLSVVVLDMDGLKGINDRFGHDQGSAFLRDLGRIMKRNTRASDVPARMGGDEFAILAPDASSEDAREIAERLRSEAADCKREIEGWEVGMSISVGIASYPTHASTAEELMTRADEAMYEAKRAGKNQVRVAAASSASASTTC